MIADVIANHGRWLFRWRSYVLLTFLPLGVWAASGPEPIEVHIGEWPDVIWGMSCVVLAFVGLGVRAYTVGCAPRGTSGRNTREQVAETLNTTGMYSVTRNPLYLGNAIIYMAIALLTQSLTVAIVIPLFLIIYLERIIATEERFLAAKFGQEYETWAARVPTFFPAFSLWTPPALPFSFRNVLRREYSGLFGIVAAVAAVNFGHEAIGEGDLSGALPWCDVLLAGAIVYVVLRYLKKHTTVLTVEGR